MKYLNPLNLPQPYVDAVKNDEYDPGQCDYTPSSLIRPPYMSALLRDNNEEIEVNVEDRFFSLIGKLTHELLEKSDDRKNASTEVRIYTQVGKWVIGMKYDRLFFDKKTRVLQDWKLTTSYKFTKDYNGNFPKVDEWEQQLNIGAYILRNGGWILGNYGEKKNFSPREVNRLEIIGLIRDYAKREALKNNFYPQNPVVVREVALWPNERVEQYVLNRAQLHDDAKTKKLHFIPPCTMEEVWGRPTQYAVMKVGQVRATKLCDTQEKAEKYIEENKLNPLKTFVQKRPGEMIRCERGYCDVAKFCPYLKRILKEREEDKKKSENLKNLLPQDSN